jgi:hypothetical protein
MCDLRCERRPGYPLRNDRATTNKPRGGVVVVVVVVVVAAVVIVSNF